MNKMNRKLEYSLMALKHMSMKPSGELTTAKEVSESYRAPFDATARVLQVMAQNGLLAVEHGVQGGYRINGDLSQVTLHQLIEMISGPTKIAKCIQEEDSCDIQSCCNIISPVQNLNRRLSSFYEGVVLSELLEGRP